jgi:hypothetical protein
VTRAETLGGAAAADDDDGRVLFFVGVADFTGADTDCVHPRTGTPHRHAFE